MSAAGRFVALRGVGGIDVVDVQGTAPRRGFTLPDGGDFTIAGTTLCVAEPGRLALHALEGAAQARELVVEGDARVLAFAGRRADAVLAGDALVAFEPVPHVESRVAGFPLHGRAVMVATGTQLAIVTPARTTALDLPLPSGSRLRGVASVFSGRCIALLVEHTDGNTVVIIESSGRLVHRVRVPVCTWHAFAAERGQLLFGSGDKDIWSVDLRYGRVGVFGTAPHAVTELAIDDDGRSVAIAGPSESEVPVITLLRADELLRATAPTLEVISVAEESVAVAEEPVAVAVVVPETVAPLPSIVTPPPAAAPIPDTLPLAFGMPAQPRTSPRLVGDALPFVDAADHLSALLALVAARAATAIAEGWHSGRISGDVEGSHPFEREVFALAGASEGFAGDRLARAHVQLAERARTVTARVHASLAAGVALPFVELARELALSPVATQILIAIAAPHARPEIARLYRILANETERPLCDEAMVLLLLGGNDARLRDQIVDELAVQAPLVHYGVIVREARGSLAVDDALLARLRGRALPRSVACTTRTADRLLHELIVDRNVLAELLVELANERSADDPVRVVVRGRRGTGRHTLIAALAARVDRSIACIDASQLSRATLADGLRRELARAHLVRAVPVVSGLELRDGADAGDVMQQVKQVLRQHAGPIVLRTSPEAHVPLDPGYVDVTLPALNETQRIAAFQVALEGIDADVELLAHRFRIGPGTMVRIATEARRRLAQAPDRDATGVVDTLARQHVAARVGAAAQRMTKLADWDQVALPDDMLDSLRELIGRARHNRTVYEDWGYDRRITTARGLTALFYGPPGTGKTMVAGLIARELGLELYRVDLAKVMSKWVGETEKNLGEIFDAAEDGQLMLLFDEADSLFAKRSEVKSANDRYANLEVNYLLQRLDTFEGVAVLTTNLEGSIDAAFKRRLSMRLYFPFPDEDMRTRLWASHVTTQVPTAGAIDYAALARRFPLSGGYIRNSALRAAFLAAQEQTALTQAHLERAVLLEYRELGKLSDNGRME